MKQLFFFIFECLLLNNVFSQSDKIQFGFIKNAKEVIKANKITREEVYTYNFNKKGIKDSTLTITYYYDSLGDLIEQKAGKTRLQFNSTKNYTNEYYPSGKLRRQIVDDRTMNTIAIYEYEYDSLGNDIFKYEYNKDTTRLTIEQKVYNEKNQLVQLRNKFNNNDFFISRLYYYNSDNELSRIEALDNGKVIYADSYEYDKLTNKKTAYLENSEGKRKTMEYFYNDDKQCIKEYTIHKTLSSFSGLNPQYENSDQFTENIYNADKTAFESNVYLDGKKMQMTRHFYFTN